MTIDQISQTRKAVLPMFESFLEKFVNIFEGKKNVSLTINKPDRVSVGNFPDVQKVSIENQKEVQKVVGEVKVLNQITPPQVQKIIGEVKVKNQIIPPEVQKVEGFVTVKKMETVIDRLERLIDEIKTIPSLPETVPVRVTNWQFAVQDGGALPLDDAYWLREEYTYSSVAGKVVPTRVVRYSSTIKETEDIRYDNSANPIGRNKFRESANA